MSDKNGLTWNHWWTWTWQSHVNCRQTTLSIAFTFTPCKNRFFLFLGFPWWNTTQILHFCPRFTWQHRYWFHQNIASTNIFKYIFQIHFTLLSLTALTWQSLSYIKNKKRAIYIFSCHILAITSINLYNKYNINSSYHLYKWQYQFISLISRRNCAIVNYNRCPWSKLFNKFTPNKWYKLIPSIFGIEHWKGFWKAWHSCLHFNKYSIEFQYPLSIQGLVYLKSTISCPSSI